jgi:hypothetical protein
MFYSSSARWVCVPPVEIRNPGAMGLVHDEEASDGTVPSTVTHVRHSLWVEYARRQRTGDAPGPKEGREDMTDMRSNGSAEHRDRETEFTRPNRPARNGRANARRTQNKAGTYLAHSEQWGSSLSHLLFCLRHEEQAWGASPTINPPPSKPLPDSEPLSLCICEYDIAARPLFTLPATRRQDSSSGIG